MKPRSNRKSSQWESSQWDSTGWEWPMASGLVSNNWEVTRRVEHKRVLAAYLVLLMPAWRTVIRQAGVRLFFTDPGLIHVLHKCNVLLVIDTRVCTCGVLFVTDPRVSTCDICLSLINMFARGAMFVTDPRVCTCGILFVTYSRAILRGAMFVTDPRVSACGAMFVTDPRISTCGMPRPTGFDQGHRVFLPRIWRFLFKRVVVLIRHWLCICLCSHVKNVIFGWVSYTGSGQGRGVFTKRFSRNIIEREHSVVQSVMLVQGEPVGDRGILTRYACQYMNVSANSGQSSSNREI